MPRPDQSTAYLRPHLHEVCAILARGLIRLREREQLAGQPSDELGESHLDFTAHQRRHAKPKPRRPA